MWKHPQWNSCSVFSRAEFWGYVYCSLRVQWVYFVCLTTIKWFSVAYNVLLLTFVIICGLSCLRVEIQKEKETLEESMKLVVKRQKKKAKEEFGLKISCLLYTSLWIRSMIISKSDMEISRVVQVRYCGRRNFTRLDVVRNSSTK